MKIYTRTGDKGQTSLFGGKRVSKSSIRVEAYGTVDELNSTIGIVIAQMANGKWQMANLNKELLSIQHDLLTIGSMLASPQVKSSRFAARRAKFKVQSLGKRVDEFEKMIDSLTKKLPQLRNFILPGGGRAGSGLHFARTVCRRAERRIVDLSQREHVDSAVIMYCNRLSDLLFTMARFINMKENKQEIVWHKV